MRQLTVGMQRKTNMGKYATLYIVGLIYLLIVFFIIITDIQKKEVNHNIFTTEEHHGTGTAH